MVGRKRDGAWRPAFLRALARTGNAQLAAQMAGIDKGTAYNLRNRDAGFAAEWARAKGFGALRLRSGQALRLRSGQALREEPGDADGPQLVVRFSKKEGAQLVRAGAGRWSAETEAAFQAALKETGNVRAAARAAGISTTALYNRRKRYPLIEAEWAAAKETGCRRVSLMLIEAAEAALDPGRDAAAEGLPAVSVAEAIAILRLHKLDQPGAPSRRGARARAQAIEDMPIEAVRDEIVRRIEAIRAHKARRAQ